MADQRLLTTVVGSFPQPDWLIDRQALLSGGVACVRNQGLWRIPEISRSRFPMVRFLALIIGWLLEFFLRREVLPQLWNSGQRVQKPSDAG